MSTNPPTQKERKGTLPSKQRNLTAPADEHLTQPEIKKLNFLGWGKAHIAQITLEQARHAIAEKITRPGSAARVNEERKKMERAGLTPPGADRISDEAVAARAASKPKSSGMKIIMDEFTNLCVAGEDPLDAVLLQAQADNPGWHMRLFNPELPAVAGPQPQYAHDDQGKPIEVGACA